MKEEKANSEIHFHIVSALKHSEAFSYEFWRNLCYLGKNAKPFFGKELLLMSKQDDTKSDKPGQNDSDVYDHQLINRLLEAFYHQLSISELKDIAKLEYCMNIQGQSECLVKPDAEQSDEFLANKGLKLLHSLGEENDSEDRGLKLLREQALQLVFTYGSSIADKAKFTEFKGGGLKKPTYYNLRKQKHQAKGGFVGEFFTGVDNSQQEAVSGALKSIARRASF